jgi:hypothetical protein
VRFFGIKIEAFNQGGSPFAGYYPMPEALTLFPSREAADERAKEMMERTAGLRVAASAFIKENFKKDVCEFRCEVVELFVSETKATVERSAV